MLDSFLVRAALAGVAIALVAAPLGCFVVWRRMAYFGDATAHAAILGVALSLAFALPVFVGTLLVATAMAVTVALLGGRLRANDTLLGVFAHGALGAGLVAVALLDLRVDVDVWLFGDILAVDRRDLVVIWGGAALVAALLAWRWQALLTATLNGDLAAASGVDPARERLVLALALALVVAVAIEVVGALLITALLIIPPAAARPFGATPERMALVAALVGVSAALGGLGAAWTLDTPAGPTIVCVAAALFALSGPVDLARRAALRRRG